MTGNYTYPFSMDTETKITVNRIKIEDMAQRNKVAGKGMIDLNMNQWLITLIIERARILFRSEIANRTEFGLQILRLIEKNCKAKSRKISLASPKKGKPRSNKPAETTDIHPPTDIISDDELLDKSLDIDLEDDIDSVGGGFAN